MPNYLFVLGAPNDAFGALLPIARKRAEAAAARYHLDPNLKIVATGGFGAHFNTTATPHRDYVNDALVRLGVPPAALEQEGFFSGNTVEDIVQIAEFAKRRELSRIAVITSAFHVARCQLIVACVLPAVEVDVVGAENPLGLDPALVEHERVAIARLRSQGGVTVGDYLYPLPVHHFAP